MGSLSVNLRRISFQRSRAGRQRKSTRGKGKQSTSLRYVGLCRARTRDMYIHLSPLTGTWVYI